MKPKLVQLSVYVTAKQNEWLANESGETGNAVTTIIRGLIQDKINKAVKK